MTRFPMPVDKRVASQIASLRRQLTLVSHQANDPVSVGTQLNRTGLQGTTSVAFWSFEDQTTDGWVTTNATPAVINTWATDGSYSLQLISAGTGNWTATSPLTPVAAGDTVTALVDVNSPTTDLSNTTLTMTFFDVNSNVITPAYNASIGAFGPSTLTVTTLELWEISVPSNAVNVQVTVGDLEIQPQGTVLNLDNVRVDVTTGIPGVVDGTVIQGSDFLNYQGLAGLGTLAAAFAPNGLTDQYGNVAPPGFNFGDWDATGALRNHFGIDDNGNTYVADASGTTRIFTGNNPAAQIYYNANGFVVTYFDPINSSIFQYQDGDTAAPVLVHQAQGATSGASTNTLTIPSTTLGNALVLAIASGGTTGNPSVSGVTFSGVPTGWVKLTAATGGIGNPLLEDVEIWANPSIPAGQTSVTVNVTGGSGTITIGVNSTEWQGLSQTGILDVARSANNNLHSTNAWRVGPTPTLSSDNDAIIAVIVGTSAVTGPGAPWTNSASLSVGSLNMVTGTAIPGTTAAISYAGTLSPLGFYVGALVALKPGNAIAQGQLVFAQAAKLCTDPVTGVLVQPGLTLYSTNGQKLWLDTSPASGLPGMSFFTGASEEGSTAAIAGNIISPGASEVMTLRMLGPGGSVHGSHPFISLFSAAKDGSAEGSGSLEYVNPAGTTVSMLGWGVGGLGGQTDKGFGGGIDLTELDQFGRNATSTTHTIVTRQYAIPAADNYVNGTRWELTCFGHGTTGTAVQLGFEYVIFGTTLFSRGVSLGGVANATNFNWQCRVGLVSGAGSGVAYIADAYFAWQTAAVSYTGSNGGMGCETNSGTVTTTSATTAYLQMWWNATTGSPSATCDASYLRRIRDA